MKSFFEKVYSEDLERLTTIFKNIFNHISEIMFLMEVKGDTFRYVFANKAALKALKISETELIGKAFEEVLPNDEAMKLKDIYTMVVQQKEDLSYEDQLFNEGQNKVSYYETMLNPIIDKDGTCSYVLAITRDITERTIREQELKEAKEKLEESEQRFKSLVEQNKDAVYSCNLNREFTSANDAVYEVTGYLQEELIGTSYEMILKKKDIERINDHFDKAIAGESQEYELEITHKQGFNVYLDIKNIPMVVDGKVVGVFGIAKDITKEKHREKELIDTKEKLQALFNHTEEGIDIIDEEGNVIGVNPAYEKMFGYKEEEIVGKPVFLLSEDKSYAKELLEKVKRGELVKGEEVKSRTKDGSIIYVNLTLSPIHNEHGEVEMISSLCRDITQQKQAEKTLKESEERYRLIAENTDDMIKVIDPNGVVQYASPSHGRMLGYEPDHFVGKSYLYTIHPDDLAVVEAKVKLAKKKTDEPTLVEFRRLHKNSEVTWIEAVMTPVFDEKDELEKLIIVSRDISERKKQAELLEYLAFHDPLTGLVNRRMFTEVIQQQLALIQRNDQSLAVMYMDIDKFKGINDTLGHEIGDELLKQFSNRLKENVRESDVLCRVGGDEFLILINNVLSKKEVCVIAERIHQSLQTPYKIRGETIKATSSIGIAMYPSAGESYKDLIRHADEALYKAKITRNNYQFYKKEGSGQN
ncbi:PAS domain S-box protein [Desertibacillus haloalkaliphilus]|uniref:PAS domain S-box protein n=1 Tax=Desertibacillus haloalkaliphilus TaxID=1328930 RepID=UPI001C27B365|nr:PAS domain S-box protein [Desertibacillus haloalkaliphilus]MBU8907702.1 PAS domain S-box protein [Desertibacillus haloalkaliphilus]